MRPAAISQKMQNAAGSTGFAALGRAGRAGGGFGRAVRRALAGFADGFFPA